jgi:hypothetical protein
VTIFLTWDKALFDRIGIPSLPYEEIVTRIQISCARRWEERIWYLQNCGAKTGLKVQVFADLMAGPIIDRVKR